MGIEPRLFHYRETRWIEIDLLIEQFETMAAIQIKSAATVSQDFFKNLQRFSDRVKHTLAGRTLSKNIVYGGDNTQQQLSEALVFSWRDIQRLLSI